VWIITVLPAARVTPKGELMTCSRKHHLPTSVQSRSVETFARNGTERERHDQKGATTW
jgi:hypothetical protein